MDSRTHIVTCSTRDPTNRKWFQRWRRHMKCLFVHYNSSKHIERVPSRSPCLSLSVISRVDRNRGSCSGMCQVGVYLPFVVCGGVKNNFQKNSYRKERLGVHCLHSMLHAGKFRAWVCPGCHLGILFLAKTIRTQSALRVDARLVCTLTQVCYVDFVCFRMQK